MDASMRRSAVLNTLLLVAVLGLFACEGSGANFLKSTPNYYPTAQQNYEYGMKELKSGSWLTALQYFQHVRANFGYSKWATLAELGAADAKFGAEKYIEAVDAYKQFQKSHPSHERVQDGYCAFKIGEAYHKMIPSDWFLAPPSYEKDQGPVIDAMRELNNFVEQYPESPYAAKGRKLVGDCIQRLAEHELYVANFYLKRDKPYAAIGRLEGLLHDFPGAKREPEILLMLGKTYMQMKKPDEARKTFVKLRDDHPDDFRAAKAKLYIDFIDRKTPKG
jgi:outer membrane protein assembly factor BamD